MRISPTDTFWVVLDPTATSERADILFETTLAGLKRQFDGGLSLDSNPTIFNDRGEAHEEAERRLLALLVYRGILQATFDTGAITRISLEAEDGALLQEIDLRP